MSTEAMLTRCHVDGCREVTGEVVSPVAAASHHMA